MRTRDKAKIAECDIVVDVGDVYDHDKVREAMQRYWQRETLTHTKTGLFKDTHF